MGLNRFERLKEVSETEKRLVLLEGIQKMYKAIQINDWKIDINNPEFMFEEMR